MGTVQGTGYSLPDGLGSDPALGTCELRDLELVASPPSFLPNREDRDEVQCQLLADRDQGLVQERMAQVYSDDGVLRKSKPAEQSWHLRSP